jgi:hypothetical protein
VELVLLLEQVMVATDMSVTTRKPRKKPALLKVRRSVVAEDQKVLPQAHAKRVQQRNQTMIDMTQLVINYICQNKTNKENKNGTLG